MLMTLISLRATKFNDGCFLKHSMIKLPDLNFVTFHVQQYFSYIVVVCYRDDGLSELIDTEIYKALEPHGIAHAKRFISRETGPEVNLDTFLITYNTFNIQSPFALAIITSG
jgi:hypothetical protein